MSPRAWLPSYVLLALIWGFSFFFIKVGLESFTPIGVAAGRITLGLVTLLVLSVILRTPPPPRWAWKYLLVASLLWVSVPWMLFGFGETQVSSALAGIINAATPLMTLLAILIAFPEERPTPWRIAGLAIGFLGIVVVVGWGSMTATPLGIVALIGAIACYGVAFPFARRYLTGPSTREPMAPVSLSLGLMVGGLIVTLPLALLTGFTHGQPPAAGPLAAVAALGILGSGLAYVLNIRVTQRADATTASTVTYLTPLVAVLAGAVLLGEQITWNEPVGGAIVVAGAAIAQGVLRPGRRRAAPHGL